MDLNKQYFRVCVDKYCADKYFYVVRPASLNKPKDNAVMFIIDKYINNSNIFEIVDNCLIFWPINYEIPESLLKKHAIIRCNKPHNEYCRFFSDNNIMHLPQPEEVDSVNGSWIAKNAVIGNNVIIMPGVYIGGCCVIGNNIYIGAGTKLVGDIEIGNNVVIRENTVIGADGLTTDRDSDGKAITMPQFGNVVIEDDVQIGSCTIIARGAIDETRICRGAKIDNGTFISHNVVVGEDSFVVGETIMFGSSSVGNRCLISGNSTIMNTVRIGDGSIVGAGAVVVKSVAEGSVVKGNPAK